MLGRGGRGALKVLQAGRGHLPARARRLRRRPRGLDLLHHLLLLRELRHRRVRPRLSRPRRRLSG
jgi:hypothetical protein